MIYLFRGPSLLLIAFALALGANGVETGHHVAVGWCIMAGCGLVLGWTVLLWIRRMTTIIAAPFRGGHRI